MADGVSVQLTGAWSAFTQAVDPKEFRARLERQLVLAHKRIGRQFVRMARQRIRALQYASNSPITRIIKASSKPLVDTGQLFQGITFSTPDPYTLRVGVHKSKIGSEAVNIAIVLHEGATIIVTAKVRAAVFAKVSKQLGAASGGAFKKGQRRTIITAARDLTKSRGATITSGRTIWRIPGRPYLSDPLNDPAFILFVRETWSEAVKIALFPPGQR